MKLPNERHTVSRVKPVNCGPRSKKTALAEAPGWNTHDTGKLYDLGYSVQGCGQPMNASLDGANVVIWTTSDHGVQQRLSCMAEDFLRL